jgi:thioredoxin-dependent peroxiredoxin
MYQIGDSIEFNLLGSDEKWHQTKDYQGKVVILYTYPRDNTPGCTTQACTFRDLNQEFKDLNAVVLGLNHGSLKSHQGFVSKFELPFPLLIDQDFTLIEQLGAKKEENKVFRKTYILDETGKLEKVYDKVSPKNNPEEVLDYLRSRRSS